MTRGGKRMKFARQKIISALSGVLLLSSVLVLSLGGEISLARTMQATQPAPIVQPGAPGEPGREISVQQSLQLGRSHYLPADARFMQHMIVHHGQAVDMGALIETRTRHSGIQLLGRRIALSQSAEIAMMQTWLTRRSESIDMPDHHPIHAMSQPSTTPIMAGMLSPAQMVELAAAEGSAFERLFLTGMIAHHQGALDMVNTLLQQAGTGEDPEMSEFLNEISADQQAEISRMTILLADLG